jgi:hypothetical protein
MSDAKIETMVMITDGYLREVTRLTAENEKLRAALHEAADELDAYYRAEYPGDHPYSKRKLAEAMRDNPARIAITQEKRDD